MPLCPWQRPLARSILNMIIGVDATVLLDRRLTGVGWYVSRMLTESCRLDPAVRFSLYAARPLPIRFECDRIRERVGSRRFRVPAVPWIQTFGRQLAVRDKLDCFWGPSHTLPIGVSRQFRTVLTVHDLVYLFYRRHMSRYNALVHRCFFVQSVRQANAIITDSQRTKLDIIEHLHIEPSKVTAVHLGVGEVFRPLERDAVRSRVKALRIHADYILAVGTLEPRKNYPLLFQAISRMPDCPLLVIAASGRGWRYRTILQELERLGLQSRVRLLDYVSNEDLVALYNGALLLVQPSLYEGFGLPLVQAMACGTPVLSSNCVCLPEIGADAVAYFESGSEDSLVQELQHLLGSEARRQTLRLAGLRRARDFDWSETARATLAVLRGDGQASPTADCRPARRNGAA